MNFDNIRLVTAQMHRQIATGTFDAPSWDLIRAAKMATSIYAPLGTTMSLGDYVRVTRTFLELFKATHLPDQAQSKDLVGQEVGDWLKDKSIVELKEDLQVSQRLTIPNPIFRLKRWRPAGIPVRIISVANQRRSYPSPSLTSGDRVSHDATLLLGFLPIFHFSGRSCPLASRDCDDPLRRAQLQEDGARLGHMG